MSHSGPTKYSIPEPILKGMAQAGIKSLRQLARRADLPTNTVQRFFTENEHISLGTYRTIAAFLQWDMQTLFNVCLSNSAIKTGKIISERAKALNVTPEEIATSLGWAGRGRIQCYFTGEVDYRPMKTYDAICMVTGITPGALCECLLTNSSVDICNQSGTLNKSAASKVWTKETNLIAAA